MKLKQLMDQWNTAPQSDLTAEVYSIRLPIHEAARIRALAELFTNRTETQIITELLRVILDEVEASFPYVQGKKVIREDEFGDPIFNDDGLTSKFSDLKKKISAEMQEALRAAS